MSKINFKTCGADIEYELHNLGKSEQLWVNGDLIVDSWGYVGAWGRDYDIAVAGLHGAAKASAENSYLKKRAEYLLIEQIFVLREMVKDLSQAD